MPSKSGMQKCLGGKTHSNMSPDLSERGKAVILEWETALQKTVAVSNPNKAPRSPLLQLPRSWHDSREELKNMAIAYSFSDLRKYSHHHSIAARTIQARTRGWLARKILWMVGGVLMVGKLVKIQKAWRGFMGRRRAARIFKDYLYYHAEKINGIYRQWLAKRLVRIKQTERNIILVSKVQSIFRGLRARRQVEERRRIRRLQAAQVMQKATRRYLAFKRCKGIVARAELYTAEINRIVKWSNQTILSDDPKITVDRLDLPSLSDWEVVHLVLVHILFTCRLTLALDIATQLKLRSPDFYFAHFCLKLALFALWPGESRVQIVLEEHLERLLALMMLERSLEEGSVTFRNDRAEHLWIDLFKVTPQLMHTINLSVNPFAKSLLHQNHETAARPFVDPISRFCDLSAASSSDPNTSRQELIEELEYFYFRYAIEQSEKGSWSLTTMALLHTLCGYEGSFGKRKGNQHLSLKRLIALTKRASANAFFYFHEVVAMQRLAIFNIFTKPHKVVASELIKFTDCWIPDFDKAKLNKLNQKTRQTNISAQVDITQAGDLYFVSARLLPVKFDQLLTPCSSSRYLRLMAGQRTPSDSDPYPYCRDIAVKPLVLFQADVEILIEQSAPQLSRLLGTVPDDIRKRGIIVNLLDFIMKTLRLVTIAEIHLTNHVRGSSGTGRNFALQLPILIYHKRERNLVKSEEVATRNLQKTYRGFRGRLKFKRLYAKRQDWLRQLRLLDGARQRLKALRDTRYKLASRIQAMVRGVQTRELLKLKKACALKVQCRFRIFMAYKVFNEKVTRKRDGPKLIEMCSIKKFKVDDLEFSLTVWRCGFNYKLVGRQRKGAKKMVCEGYVYRDELERLLRTHNDAIVCRTKDDRNKLIRAWHHERVTDFLVESIGIVSPMTRVTNQLGNQLLLIVMNKGASVKNYHILKNHNIRQPLKL